MNLIHLLFHNTKESIFYGCSDKRRCQIARFTNYSNSEMSSFNYRFLKRIQIFLYICIKHETILLSRRFWKKEIGILRTPPSVRLSVRPSDRPTGRLSVCPSCYLLLNYWAAFHQTCYITSPHYKGVREQHFYVRPFFHASVVLPFVRHAISS